MKNISMYIAANEATTEAVLQLTLQVFIIFQGDGERETSTMQIISIFTSSISISLAATQQLLQITRNKKVRLQIETTNFEDLQFKEKWCAIGKGSLQ